MKQRASDFTLSVGLLFLGVTASCSVPSGGSLPLVSRGTAFAPVEGLETPELAARARGALLSASGEKPIAITFLGTDTRRDHPIRGVVVALAGPAPDGRFVYAVRDDRAGVAVRRGHVRGGDMPVARFHRPIAALAIAPDGERAAILASFADDDPRSRGGVLRELVVVALASGEFQATGFACWSATPSWIDGDRIACVVAADDGARSVAVLDSRDPGSVRHLRAGDGVLADFPRPDGELSLIVFHREDGRSEATRVPLAKGEAVALELRGSLQPLACVADGLIVSFSAPTLGAEPQWEFDLLGPQIALASIKLHDLATGSFHTLDTRASPRRSWSAGRLDP